ncbi:hypothetical protein SAMN04488168_10577 [Bacillus sp. 491mf]|uniref:hypothetical protein n=1 Tax=Bacillus TaxID=1386 RepID=UPI0008EA8BAA|nr:MULTISPECIES: hypothetical protein [unclassified Bacillus (in: firmicutes)]SFC48436.1 hypothetical protein SAMN04488168_10577 [Bacillus sp. 491mf]
MQISVHKQILLLFFIFITFALFFSFILHTYNVPVYSPSMVSVYKVVMHSLLQ